MRLEDIVTAIKIGRGAGSLVFGSDTDRVVYFNYMFALGNAERAIKNERNVDEALQYCKDLLDIAQKREFPVYGAMTRAYEELVEASGISPEKQSEGM